MSLRRISAHVGAAAMLGVLGAAGLRAADEPKPKADAPSTLDVETMLTRSRPGGDAAGLGGERKYRDFAEVTRGAERIEGMFTLHKKDDHLYAEIKPFQFDQPLLLPITIARGLGQTGMPVGDPELVLV